MYKTVILLAAACLVEGCLITNCPRGGKRSSRPGPRDPDCRRCGPNMEGRCLGRTICCGPRIGCLVGTPAVLNQCSSEAVSAQIVRGAQRCSIGLCLSDGVCCSTEACKIDLGCEMEQSVDVCSLSEAQTY